MVNGHRHRLISEGLVKPMAEEELARRKALRDRRIKGEKITDPPVFCVYRKDDPDRSVYDIPDAECEDAELIADHLYSWEAVGLVRSLGMNDKQQPPRPNPAHPPLSMYGTCMMSVWEAWEARHAQATMFEV